MPAAETTAPHASTRPGAPKASWLTLAVVEVLAGLLAVFSLASRYPNNGLLELLGYPGPIATLPPGPDAAVAAIMRMLGVWWLALVVLALVVTLTAYRNGQRWAWWTLWLLPGAYLVNFVGDLVQLGGLEYSTLGVVYLYFAVPAVIALLLGVRVVRHR